MHVYKEVHIDLVSKIFHKKLIAYFFYYSKWSNFVFPSTRGFTHSVDPTGQNKCNETEVTRRVISEQTMGEL